MCIGQEYIDNVTLSNGLVIEKQSFGSAQFSQGFAEVDGVMLIAPVDKNSEVVAEGGRIPAPPSKL